MYLWKERMGNEDVYAYGGVCIYLFGVCIYLFCKITQEE